MADQTAATFDPSQPYSVTSAPAPASGPVAFDPGQPFTVVPAPSLLSKLGTIANDANTVVGAIPRAVADVINAPSKYGMPIIGAGVDQAKQIWSEPLADQDQSPATPGPLSSLKILAKGGGEILDAGMRGIQTGFQVPAAMLGQAAKEAQSIPVVGPAVAAPIGEAGEAMGAVPEGFIGEGGVPHVPDVPERPGAVRPASTPEDAARPVMATGNVDDAIKATEAAVSANEPAIEPAIEPDMAPESAISADVEPANEPAAPVDTGAQQDKLNHLFGGLNQGTVEQTDDGTYLYHTTDEAGTPAVLPIKVWTPGTDETAPGEEAISPEMAKAQTDHYAQLGVDVVYFQNDPHIPFDGAVDPTQPNTLFLSNDPTRNAAQVGAHEVTHVLDTTKMPDGTSLGDLLHQQIRAGITAQGQEYAADHFGSEAPDRSAFPEGAQGDAAHADAIMAHLVNELGADIGGEAPKFGDFAPKIADAVEQRYGADVAKDILQKFIAGIKAAMDTIRGFFGQDTTKSQNWVTNLGEIHDTLAQMYAAKYGDNLEIRQTANEVMQSRIARDMATAPETKPEQTAGLSQNPTETPTAVAAQAVSEAAGTPGIPAEDASPEPSYEAAPTAATPAVQAPQMAAARVARPTELESLDPTKIKVDANRFQFKAGGDESGVTDRLHGVQKWDPMLAGTTLIWRDGAGQDWVADGHQRVALANRLTAEGQEGVRINAFVLNSRDGFTDADARAIAAAKNIAEGTGTVIDAAKVMRHAIETSTMLPDLPPRSTLVKDGRAVASLSPEAFGMAVNEIVPVNQAAIVGRLVADGADQTEAMRVLAQAKPENARQAEMIIRDMMATGTERGTTTGSLFGDEHFATSVVLERAKIIDDAQKQLVRDKTTFRTLISEAERIQSHGANKLDADANKTRLTNDEQAAQFLTNLATRKGPVSDALTAVARQFKDGEISRAEAARRFVGTVREAVAEGLERGATAGGTVDGAAEEVAAQGPTLFSPKRDKGDNFFTEPGAEDARGNALPQTIIPGAEGDARQLAAAREAQGRGMMAARVGQKDAGGLFGEPQVDEPKQGVLFSPKRDAEYERFFRGEYSGNKGGNFYSPDKEWARQFTQSGQDHEISERRVNKADIYEPQTPVYAGDPDAVDAAIAAARRDGFKAVRLDEGAGQPKSIFVFDKSALSLPEKRGGGQELFSPRVTPEMRDWIKRNEAEHAGRRGELPLNDNVLPFPARNEYTKPGELPGITTPKPEAEARPRGLSAKTIEGTGAERQRSVSPDQTYHVGEEAPQIEAADRLVAKDYDKAVAIAMREVQPPAGLHPQFVFMAVERKATLDGDHALIERLQNSRIAEEATTMGQQIAAWRNRDPFSAVSALKSVEAARAAYAEKRGVDLQKETRAGMADLDNNIAAETKKASALRPKNKPWDAFVASITCAS